MKARRLFRCSGFLVLTLAACLTVNVYIYPSKEVDETAQKLIEDIRGGVVGGDAAPAVPGDSPDRTRPGARWWNPLGTAHAAGGETTVSSPAIDALKLKLKNRAPQLNPFFDAGAIGEGNDGLVAVRDVSVLPMKDRAQVNRIVKEENDDRLAMYREVAKELKVEPKDLPRVQGSFAREWAKFARPGWWVQAPDGKWERRRP